MTQSVNGTVLLVEDEWKLRRLLRKHLERIGLQVIEVGDGRSAIRQLSENPPDIVCLDLMLPELSGYDVCEFIRASPSLKHIPVLVVSARALPEDRAQAEKAGASGYLIKPFSATVFLTKVTSLLQAYARVEVNAK
jgi:DNA-binding response OmpR family regulator